MLWSGTQRICTLQGHLVCECAADTRTRLRAQPLFVVFMAQNTSAGRLCLKLRACLGLQFTILHVLVCVFFAMGLSELIPLQLSDSEQCLFKIIFAVRGSFSFVPLSITVQLGCSHVPSYVFALQLLFWMPLLPKPSLGLILVGYSVSRALPMFALHHLSLFSPQCTRLFIDDSTEEERGREGGRQRERKRKRERKDSEKKRNEKKRILLAL